MEHWFVVLRSEIVAQKVFESDEVRAGMVKGESLMSQVLSLQAVPVFLRTIVPW